MKKLILTLLFAMATIGTVLAANTKQTVAQVTSAVELSDDVDYIITGTDPFATAGTINITNTDHAVIIFQNIRPSKVTDAILSHIFINGAPAVKGDLTSANAIKGSNCQVKMYNTGSIVMPYAQDMKPLTVYDGQNFEGEMYNNLTEGHSGGYMKTLTANSFNNKIRSFKLKRGYMVTFAVGTGGWGYSRCFIADQEDLEVATLPAILDKRISSYRIFKWWNSSKKGVHDTSVNGNAALGTTWAFDWAQGNASLLPDVEWVPNHIYEDWPSSATCGSVTGSCHMKTNNEPANNSDDHPQDVATVLNNWENLMRTGMRLCSPATHDGGWGWHNEFMKAIDERGWRCDLVDFHGYWDGEWGSLDWRIDTYAFGRNVWFSEWLWGASWNNNGAFASNRRSDDATYSGTVPVLQRLNSNTRVERYAYWNSEQGYTKIWRDGKLTKLGEYYSKMDAGLGYNAATNTYIPKETQMQAPKNLAANYTRTKGTVELKWEDLNGDLVEEMAVMCKAPDATMFSVVETVAPKDKSSKGGDTYSVTVPVDEPGVYTYRIRIKTYNNKTFTSNDEIVNVAPAQGTKDVQFGRLSLDNNGSNEVAFSETMSATPAVFIGTVSNKNTAFLFNNNTGQTNSTTKFTYQMLAWATNTGEVKNIEEVPFLAMLEGNYDFCGVKCEVAVVKSGKASTETCTDVAEVTFNQPFPEGVTPVVLTEIRKPSYTTKTSLSTRVFDVTNKGFKFIIYSEDKSAQKVALQQNVCYLAIAPGIGYADEDAGIIIAAGHGTEQIYGVTGRNVEFTAACVNEASEQGIKPIRLKSPAILTNLQTNNYPTSCMLRRTADITEKADDVTWTTGTKIKKVNDHDIVVDGKEIKSNSTLDSYKNYRENVAWVAVAFKADGGSTPEEFGYIPTAIRSVKENLTPMVVGNRIIVPGVNNFKLYRADGQEVSASAVQQPGTYIIKVGNKTAKIVVR